MTGRAPEDFSAEVEAHLALETDRLMAEGLSRDAARAAAIRAFGSPTRVREQYYDRSRWIWLEQFRQDLRYAWRGLRASPAFLCTTVLTLAVGLSLLTVAFMVFNAYVLRPFAVADPDRLYRITWQAPDAVGTGYSWREYDELNARTDLFDAVIGQDMRFVTSDGRTLVESAVSPNYFSVLRPRMLLGRPLGAADENQAVGVLGQAAWVRLFAGDRGVLGRTLDLDGHPITIVGVVHEAFGGLDEFPRDVWIPADRADARGTEAVARLRPDVNRMQATVRLTEFARRVATTKMPREQVRPYLVPSGTPNPLSVGLLAVLSPVFAVFALVLLAACFNVSNVMLARAIARHREIAVRLSLGASRSRIVRQLLTEGLLVAVLAGIAAVVLAAWVLRAAIVVLFSTLPPVIGSLLRLAPMPFDVRVFGFAFAVAAATTLLFALLPALQASRQSLTEALRGVHSGHVSGSRMRNLLVIAQVAVSIVLVVAALLLARNFAALTRLDLGFSTANVYSVNIRGNQNTWAAKDAAALAADPHVASVVVTSGNPLFSTRSIPAGPDGGRAPTTTLYTFVSPEFFDMLRLPIARGRAFRPEEAAAAARVALVSQATARAFWPGVDPIGQTVVIDNPRGANRDENLEGYSRVTVVGTVPDVVSGIMVEGADPAHVYLPMTAADHHATAMLITPRASSDFRPDLLRESLRRIGRDPDLIEIISLEEMRQTQIYPLRAASWVGALLGGIALVLSVAGLYGVLSYTLAQRTREIGIRMALGATASAVVALIMRQSVRMAGLGAAIGLGAGFAALKALASVVHLRAVTLLDPVAFGGAVLVVSAAASLAAYYPSRRATRIDPAETLRADA
jgi:predicted permease